MADLSAFVQQMNGSVDRYAQGFPCGYVLVETDPVLQDSLGGYFYNRHGIRRRVALDQSVESIQQSLIDTFLFAWTQSVAGARQVKYLVWRHVPWFAVITDAEETVVSLVMELATNFPFGAYRVDQHGLPFLLPLDDISPAVAIQTYYDTLYGPDDYCQ